MADTQYNTDVVTPMIQASNMKKRKFGLLNAGLFNEIVFPGRTYLTEDGEGNLRSINPSLDENGFGVSYRGDAFNTGNITFSGEWGQLYADPDQLEIKDKRILMKRRRRDESTGEILETYNFQIGLVDLSSTARSPDFANVFVTKDELGNVVQVQINARIDAIATQISEAQDLTSQQAQNLDNIRIEFRDAGTRLKEESNSALASGLNDIEYKLANDHYTKPEVNGQIRESVRLNIERLQQAIDEAKDGQVLLDTKTGNNKDEIIDFLNNQYIANLRGIFTTTQEVIQMINDVRTTGGGLVSSDALQTAITGLDSALDDRYVKETDFETRASTFKTNSLDPAYAAKGEYQATRNDFLDVKNSFQTFRNVQAQALQANRNYVNDQTREIVRKFDQYPSVENLQNAVNAIPSEFNDVKSQLTQMIEDNEGFASVTTDLNATYQDLRDFVTSLVLNMYPDKSETDFDV